MKYLMDNTQGLYDALEEDFYTAPALQPAMPWIDNVAPTPPSGLTVETPENGYWKLSWQPATDNDKRNAPMYVIYGSATYPVDTSNPENILAQRVQGTEYTYAPIRPWTARKYFAVDRKTAASSSCLVRTQHLTLQIKASSRAHSIHHRLSLISQQAVLADLW